MKILDISDGLPLDGQGYHAVFLAASPEARAIDIVTSFDFSAQLKIVLRDNAHTELSYKENSNILKARRYDEIAMDNIESYLPAATSFVDDGKIKVLIDVSCLSRPALARLVYTLVDLCKFKYVDFHFVYSVAKFNPPLAGVRANEAIEPVHPRCSGWPSNQSDPTSLLIGLGYELHKAEGASEYLDPSEQWAFVPLSPIEEYFLTLKKNNSGILNELDPLGRVIQYRVDQPSRTFGQLELIVSNLVRKSNPVILPFGPKIFFALSLLQSIRHPEIGVWHVTGEKDEAPVDRSSSGLHVGFSALVETDC